MRHNYCHKLTVFFVAITFVMMIGSCATTPRVPPPTLDEIVKLSQDKVPSETIIQRIHDSRAVYMLSASQLVQLGDRGVTPAVLDYMQSTYVQAYRNSSPGWGVGGFFGNGGSGVGVGVGF